MDLAGVEFKKNKATISEFGVEDLSDKSHSW